MKLSEHFSLSEFTKSQTAIRHGWDNQPPPNSLELAKVLCETILEKIRDHYGRPVIITSGYRSPRLNRAIGSKTNSHHVWSADHVAVDVEVPGISNLDLWQWIKGSGLVWDQAIAEYVSDKDPSAGWVHIGLRHQGNRKQAFRVNG